MKTYILTVDIAVDGSAGEYSFTYIDDVYLGYGKFENDEDALQKAKNLNIERHSKNEEWVKYESIIKITKID